MDEKDPGVTLSNAAKQNGKSNGESWCHTGLKATIGATHLNKTDSTANRKAILEFQWALLAKMWNSLWIR